MLPSYPLFCIYCLTVFCFLSYHIAFCIVAGISKYWLACGFSVATTTLGFVWAILLIRLPCTARATVVTHTTFNPDAVTSPLIEPLAYSSPRKPIYGNSAFYAPDEAPLGVEAAASLPLKVLHQEHLNRLEQEERDDQDERELHELQQSMLNESQLSSIDESSESLYSIALPRSRNPLKLTVTTNIFPGTPTDACFNSFPAVAAATPTGHGSGAPASSDVVCCATRSARHEQQRRRRRRNSVTAGTKADATSLASDRIYQINPAVAGDAESSYGASRGDDWRRMVPPAMTTATTTTTMEVVGTNEGLRTAFIISCVLTVFALCAEAVCCVYDTHCFLSALPVLSGPAIWMSLRVAKRSFSVAASVSAEQMWQLAHHGNISSPFDTAGGGESAAMVPPNTTATPLRLRCCASALSILLHWATIMVVCVLCAGCYVAVIAVELARDNAYITNSGRTELRVLAVSFLSPFATVAVVMAVICAMMGGAEYPEHSSRQHRSVHECQPLVRVPDASTEANTCAARTFRMNADHLDWAASQALCGGLALYQQRLSTEVTERGGHRGSGSGVADGCLPSSSVFHETDVNVDGGDDLHDLMTGDRNEQALSTLSSIECRSSTTTFASGNNRSLCSDSDRFLVAVSTHTPSFRIPPRLTGPLRRTLRRNPSGEDMVTPRTVTMLYLALSDKYNSGAGLHLSHNNHSSGTNGQQQQQTRQSNASSTGQRRFVRHVSPTPHIHHQKKHIETDQFTMLIESIEEVKRKEDGASDQNAYVLTTVHGVSDGVEEEEESEAVCLVWGLLPFSFDPVGLAVNKAKLVRAAFEARLPVHLRPFRTVVAAIVYAPHSPVSIIGTDNYNFLYFVSKDQHFMGRALLRRGREMYKRVPFSVGEECAAACSSSASANTSAMTTGIVNIAATAESTPFRGILLDSRATHSAADHILTRPCGITQESIQLTRSHSVAAGSTTAYEAASRRVFVCMYDFVCCLKSMNEEWQQVVQRREMVGREFQCLTDATQNLQRGNTARAKEMLEEISQRASEDPLGAARNADNVAIAQMMLEDLTRAGHQ